MSNTRAEPPQATNKSNIFFFVIFLCAFARMEDKVHGASRSSPSPLPSKGNARGAMAKSNAPRGARDSGIGHRCCFRLFNKSFWKQEAAQLYGNAGSVTR
ncbi:hypothetical protein ISCGN_017648 [Ixodes scapularis]